MFNEGKIIKLNYYYYYYYYYIKKTNVELWDWND